MGKRFVCMHVYHICAWCIRRSEEGTLSPVTRLHVGGYDLLTMWELGTEPPSFERAAVFLNAEPITSSS